MIRVGLIGAGLQARRRLPVLNADRDAHVVAVTSLDRDRAEELARTSAAEVDNDWSSTIARRDIDAVLVCTTPDSHHDIVSAALAAGKHVLVEKPMTQSSGEARKLADQARAADRVLRCGFNHRFHPAISCMLDMAAKRSLGKPLMVRANYGFGGRSTMTQEWRGDPTRAAGGHLMEQGIHLFDLVHAIEPEIEQVSGRVDNLGLDMNSLEDVGTAVLSRCGFVASLTSSLVQWRNTFSFELACQRGYVEVNGLGGSYGTETLTIGQRDEHAPFSETQTYFRGEDRSWQMEWQHFRAMIDGTTSREYGDDAVRAMEWVEAAYTSSRTGQSVTVGR